MSTYQELIGIDVSQQRIYTYIIYYIVRRWINYGNT